MILQRNGDHLENHTNKIKNKLQPKHPHTPINHCKLYNNESQSPYTLKLFKYFYADLYILK